MLWLAGKFNPELLNSLTLKKRDLFFMIPIMISGIAKKENVSILLAYKAALSALSITNEIT